MTASKLAVLSVFLFSVPLAAGAADAPAFGVPELKVAVERNPLDPEAHVRLGDAYLQGRDAAASVREYRAALELSPTDVDTRVKLGTVLLIGRLFEEAEIEGAKAAELAPNRAAPLALLGRARAGLGRWGEAADAFGRAIQAAPDDEALRVLLSSVYVSQKDPSKAEEALRAGLDAIPPSRAIRGALVDVLVGQGRYAESDELVQELLHLGPDDRQLHRTAALYYLRRGIRPQAEALFKRALVLSGEDTGNRVESLADLSNFHLAAGNVRAAEESLEESRVLAPDNPTTLSRLANLYLLTNDVAKAEPLVEKLSEKGTADSSVRVLRAQLDLAQGRVEDARKALESVLESAPDAANARFFLAKTYGIQRRWDKALDLYLNVVAEVPNHFFANLDLAKVYLALRRPAEALDAIDKVLKMQPDFGEARRVRAETLFLLGRAQDAEAVYRELIRTASGADLAALETRLGQTLEAQNRLGEAFGSYERSARAAPTLPEPVLRQMSILDRLGKREEADRIAKEFLKSAGDSAPILLTMAARALEGGDTSAARKYVARAADVDGGSAAARELEARVHLAEGDDAGARAALDAALGASPDQLSALLLLSGLLEKQGKSAEAQLTNEHILRLAPQNVSAANNLAMVYAEEPSTRAEALRLARLAAAGAPGNPLVLDTLGWVEYRMEDYEDALRHIEEANRLLPAQPEIAFHLAAVYAKSGKRESASALLKGVLEKAPQGAWVEEARKLAAEIGASPQ